MKDRFLEQLKSNFPEVLQNRILLGCSGGMDSVVLADLCFGLGLEIGLAHCNFNLRGAESEQDEAFVYELSKTLGVPFYGKSFETREWARTQKVSIQMAARELRYEWFEELARDFEYGLIATAHHADDNLETFLINLSRGSGPRGLMGIPSRNGRVVRPLLGFHKEEIAAYASHRGLRWREDSSNADVNYLRNAIRHKVIPAFEQVVPSLLAATMSTRDHLEDAMRLLDDYVQSVHGNVCTANGDRVEIRLPQLNEYPNPDLLLYELLRPFGFTQWADITDLVEAQSGKQVYSATHRLLKDRGRLILAPLDKGHAARSLWLDDLEELRQLPWLEAAYVDGLGDTSPQRAYIDPDKLNFPLQIRSWRHGDWFCPYGLKGRKKLSKFFKDEKLSLLAKEEVRLLCSGDDVVWVIGYRADDRFKVDASSKQILRLTTVK